MTAPVVGPGAFVDPGGNLRIPRAAIASVVSRREFAALLIAVRDDPVAYPPLHALAVLGRTTPNFAVPLGTEPVEQANEPSENWLQTKEVADLAGVTERAVRKACASGRLPAARHGAAWRIRGDHAARYIASRKDPQ